MYCLILKNTLKKQFNKKKKKSWVASLVNVIYFCCCCVFIWCCGGALSFVNYLYTYKNWFFFCLQKEGFIHETKSIFLKLIDWFYDAFLSVSIQINVNHRLRGWELLQMKRFDLKLWGKSGSGVTVKGRLRHIANPIIKFAKESQINHLRNFLYIFFFFLIWKYQNKEMNSLYTF